MGSILSKMREFLIPDDRFEDDTYTDAEDTYEEYDDSYEEGYDEMPNIRIMPKPESEEQQTVLVRKPLREECKHIDFVPYSFEDLGIVVDALRTGKAVVLHLATLSDDFRQRIMDFCSGVVCTMECISEVTTGENDNDVNTIIMIPADAEIFGV